MKTLQMKIKGFIYACKIYKLKGDVASQEMYVSCTDPSCHNWFPDFLLVTQNSFTTAYPLNCQSKPVLAAWIRT